MQAAEPEQAIQRNDLNSSIKISLPVPLTITLSSDKRREARYPTNGNAVVGLATDSGNRVCAQVLDISRSGMKLQMGKRLEPGATVHISLNEIVCRGEIRYRQAVGGAFEYGVALERSSKTG